MNKLFLADIQEAKRAFGSLCKIKEQDSSTGAGCGWVRVWINETTSADFFPNEKYPDRYLVIYIPGVMSDNGQMDSVVFASERIPVLIGKMLNAPEDARRFSSLDVTDYHKRRLKTKQAVSFYEQYLNQTNITADHDGEYWVTMRDPAHAEADHRTALLALKYDYPEYFWFAEPTWWLYSNRINMKCKPCSAERKRKAMADLDRTIRDLTAGTAHSCSLNKAKAIYNRIVSMRNYHSEDPDDYHFTGPVQNGKGCCSGYAKLFKIAMNRAGIPCQIVHGDNHAWNIALIDGTVCAFDVTWESKADGRIGKRYFALSIDKMLENHKMDDAFKEVT